MNNNDVIPFVKGNFAIEGLSESIDRTNELIEKVNELKKLFSELSMEVQNLNVSFFVEKGQGDSS